MSPKDLQDLVDALSIGPYDTIPAGFDPALQVRAPAIGDTYVDPNGQMKVWDGKSWVRTTAGIIGTGGSTGPAPKAPKKKHIDGRCPKCGVHGQFIKMALCCPEHGPFGGC